MMKQDKKPIQIDSILYNDLKNYCKDHGFVLKSLVERLIKAELEKNGIRLSTQEIR